MSFVGFLHLVGVYRDAEKMAELTSYARLMTGTLFFTLYSSGMVDELGLLVAFYDLANAMLYLLVMKR